jgi:hypothetical protein
LNSARRRTCSAGQVYVCILLLFPCNGLMLSTTPSVFQANDLIQKAIRVQDRLCIKYLDYTIITSSFFISELPAPPTASILPYGMYPSLTALPSSTLYPLRPYQSPSSFLILSLTSLNPPRFTLPGLAGPAKSPPNLDLALGLGLVGALGPPVPTNAGTVTLSPEGI